MSKNSGLQSSGSQQLPTSQHCRNEGSRHLIRPASLTFLPIESVSCLRVGKLCTGHCFDESLTPKKFCQCARKGKCNWRIPTQRANHLDMACPCHIRPSFTEMPFFPDSVTARSAVCKHGAEPTTLSQTSIILSANVSRFFST